MDIQQLLNEPEYDVKNFAVWGECHMFKFGQRGLVLKNYLGDLSQSEKAKYFECIVKTYILYYTAQAPI